MTNDDKELAKDLATFIIKIVISALAVGVAVLCLTKCVNVTHHPEFNAFGGSNWVPKDRFEIFNSMYSPIVVIICSVAELVVIWALKMRFIYVDGLLLNLIGTIGPYIWMIYSQSVNNILNSHISDYSSSYNEYKFLFPVYIIIAIGGVISVLYIVLLILNRKKKELKPQQA